MRLLKVDLWKCDGTLCITTNGTVKRNGCAVMGAGVAKQAAERIPGIDAFLGKKLTQRGNKVSRIAGVDLPVRYDQNVLSFPVKHHWRERADIDLIAKSAEELRNLFEFGFVGLEGVFLPKPGCANGGLDWNDVEPVLEQFLGHIPNLYVVDKYA